jgi:hypothetical protein
MPTISEGHLARSLERSRARCPGRAARKGPRTAWGQYESEGAFPAFSSTHPKKTPGSELIQPGADQTSVIQAVADGSIAYHGVQ